MSLENVVILSVWPNLANLSLLNCQLFVGGNFKAAHVIYHTDALDGRFIRQLDSSCAMEIPIKTTDVTRFNYEILNSTEC